MYPPWNIIRWKTDVYLDDEYQVPIPPWAWLFKPEASYESWRFLDNLAFNTAKSGQIRRIMKLLLFSIVEHDGYIPMFVDLSSTLLSIHTTSQPWNATVFNVYRRATFRGLFVFTWKWRAKRFDPAGVHVLFNSFSKTSVKLGNTPLADSTSEAFGFSLVVNIHGSNATLFQVKLYLSMG